MFQWSRTSDRIGRKPVLLFGMVGTVLSMLLFGLSRTFSPCDQVRLCLYVVLGLSLTWINLNQPVFMRSAEWEYWYVPPSFSFTRVHAFRRSTFNYVGVIKSTMGELTDTTNRAEAYALMTVVWALGGTLG